MNAPIFRLGDIVRVSKNAPYHGDWKGQELEIAAVHRDRRDGQVTYWTWDDPDSDGKTSDWPEDHLELVRRPRRFVSHRHHGRDVWSDEAYVGRHREICLCWACEKLKPGQPDNCRIAQRLYETCVEFGLTTPVLECPEFGAKP